jgi:hypothetical protein
MWAERSQGSESAAADLAARREGYGLVPEISVITFFE